MLNNIGGGVHAFEKQYHIFEKGGSHLLKHYNIILYYWGFTPFRGGFTSYNILYIMQLSELFETEFYCNYKCVTKSPYVWSVGNSQRAVDNVQTVAKPLFKQHEDF